MKFFFTTYFLFLIFVLYSCAPTKKINTISFTNPIEFESQLKERDLRIQTFWGTGSITFESPEMSNNARFKILIKKPDSLLIELKGPFGISIGTLMLSREKFIFVNTIQNRAQIGITDPKIISTFTNIPITFDEIINLFTGTYPNSAFDFSSANLETGEEGLIIKSSNTEKKKELWIDGNNGNITRYIDFDDNGKMNIDLKAKSFEQTDNIITPYWIRIVFPKERRSITIAYDDIKLNNPVNCNLLIPETIENIEYF